MKKNYGVTVEFLWKPCRAFGENDLLIKNKARHEMMSPHRLLKICIIAIKKIDKHTLYYKKHFYIKEQFHKLLQCRNDVIVNYLSLATLTVMRNCANSNLFQQFTAIASSN